MKRRVRLTEQDLHRIVKDSVNMILETEFKQVDNLNDYIQQNNLQMKPASKFQRVNTQSGKSYINQYGKQKGMDKRQIGRMVRKGGAPLSTVAGDGTQETNNMVTRNHTVLNNVGNTANRWAAETPTFKRKYEKDPSANGVYKPKGGPMNAAQINEPISFIAPWGERMNVDKGGYILQDPNNPNDIYGISAKDFDSTYRFNENKQYKTNRNMKQTIRLTESELRHMISESVRMIINEVAGYNDTMQKAGNNFNQNTFMGRVRSKLQPQKYQQYQRIQQQGNQIGQQAADNVNAETEKVPIGCGGKYGTTYNPRWNAYAQEQGSNNLSGEQLYNQRTASDQAKINKYGTGGRVMLPLQGYNDSYEGPERQYREQQRLLNRPYK